MRKADSSAHSARSPRGSGISSVKRVAFAINTGGHPNCHWPIDRTIAATHAQFAHFHGERFKPETRWRSKVDLNCQTDSGTSRRQLSVMVSEDSR